MSEPDHEIIYLEPRDHQHGGETGRQWCQDNVWLDCAEAATKYVRTDAIERLTEERDLLRRQLTGRIEDCERYAQEHGEQRAEIERLTRELAERDAQIAAALAVIKHRYVGSDLVDLVGRTEDSLKQSTEIICRLRGETDANADLKRFVHYVNHTERMSPGEVSLIIDFAQGQKARAEAAEAARDEARAAVEKMREDRMRECEAVRSEARAAVSQMREDAAILLDNRARNCLGQRHGDNRLMNLLADEATMASAKIRALSLPNWSSPPKEPTT